MGFIRTLRRGVTLSSVGLAAAAAVLTARHYLETPQPLESALGGDGRIDRRHGGDVYYNVAGPRDGQPLVLLHDFYPGASNFEFRRLYPRLAERYRVFAPDWLGFGMSEHPHVAYTGEFYANMLAGFLRDVVERPATIVAHGHAANIAVRCASDTPELVDRLILIAPDVFAGLRADPTPSQALTRATQRAFLGILPYALLSSKPVLRWMTFNRGGNLHDTAASEERVEHLYASAHQFGGQHALLAFLTGELDLPMQNAFALLEPPVLILAGDQDRRHPRVDLEDIVVLNPNAELEIITGAGDPIHEDRPEPVIATLSAWLSEPRSRHAPGDALLYPFDDADTLEDEVPDETETTPASVATDEAAHADSSLVSGGIEHADDDVTPIVLPTEGATEPRAAETEEGEDMETRDESLTGTPGSVVPGVSDMGLEGPSTAPLGGIGSVGDEGVTLGPPADQAATQSEEESVSALLPEAGDTAPTDEAEQSARAGMEPPLSPATNIGYVGSRDTADRETMEGDVAGLAQIVQTPESDIQSPEEGIASSESAVHTHDDAVDTAEMIEAEKDTQSDAGTAQARTRGPSRATSGIPREASPRSQPGSRGGTGQTKRAQSGGSSKAQKRHHQTGHHKHNRPSGK